MNQTGDPLAPYANKLIHEFAKEAATYKRIEELLSKASGPDFKLLQDLDVGNRFLQNAHLIHLGDLTFRLEILSILFNCWDYENDTDWHDFDDDLRIALVNLVQYIVPSLDSFYVVSRSLKKTINNVDPSKKVFDPEVIESQEAKDLFIDIENFGDGLLDAARYFRIAYFSMELPA